MTWCFGKITQNAVFLFADSAVSSSSPLKVGTSSFGEPHVEGSSYKPNVEERHLKLFRVVQFAIAFAGDVDAGYCFIDALESLIECTLEADSMVQKAAELADFTNYTNARIVVGWYSSKPRLIVFDSTGASGIAEVVESIHVGSVPPDFTELTERLLQSIPHSDHDSMRWLAQPLSLMQSYGLHHSLMEHGIGGAFACCWIDKAGFHWQPDMLFVLHDSRIVSPNMVGTLFRDDVMCIFASTSEHNRVFVNAFANESAEITRQRATRAYSTAMKDFDDVRFDFVVFLNFEQHIVTVIEMRKEQRHQLMVLKPSRPDAGEIGIYWSGELRDRVTTIPNADGLVPAPNLCLRWEPYRPLLGQGPEEDVPSV